MSGVPDMPESEVSLKSGELYVTTERITVFELPPGEEEKVFKSNVTYFGAPSAKAVVLPEGTYVMCIGPRLVDACWILDFNGAWVLTDGIGLKPLGEE